MKLFNKRGAALLQVLLVAAVLAGMATMLLRASLSRTSMSRRTRRTIVAQMFVSRCQARVNAMWAAKNEYNFRRDLAGCFMKCTAQNNGVCTAGQRTFECSFHANHILYKVTAEFTTQVPNEEGYCPITYTLETPDTNTVEVPL